MNPQYPVYVPTKGRWESRLTIKALEEMGVPYYAVVQPGEYEQYAAVIDPAKILQLDPESVVPADKGGLVAARNWCLDHARSIGAPWHWQIDDNIRGFYRFNRNMKVPVVDGTIFRAAEDFTNRYENVAQSGFQYYMFAPRKWKYPAFYLNTRIYSCTFYRTDIDHRWRGVFNDDTDLSLRLLKDGWCTILFNAFLANKMNTMTVKGGNTGIYQEDGRLKMAQELVDQHPDVVRIYKRWGRYQHLVDYRPFKANLLRKKEGLIIPEGVNNYGMVYQEKINGEWITKDPAEPMARFSGSGETEESENGGQVAARRPRSKKAAEPAGPAPEWDKLIIKGA